MKRRTLSVLIAATLAASMLVPTTAMADSQKVVTLGADLTEDQVNAILTYFGVRGQNVQRIQITNQDERSHLGSYVPLEQIGTKTFSCALVNPTNSGGIQVKTANLTWVTSNMIASTLSTSGVVNCEVLAASPFAVSGTGALTGVMMAYETATGTQLDETKKDLANQELVTTGTIANSIGQAEATQIVNQIKIDVIQNQVTDQDQVNQIVDQVVDGVTEEINNESGESAEQVVSLSEEDRQMLQDLANQIAQQQYDYEEMQETLERVEENVESIREEQMAEPEAQNGEELIVDDTTPEETPETELAADSILLNTDDTALGEDVQIDATAQEAVAETEPADDQQEETAGFEITTTDDYTETQTEAQAQPEVQTEAQAQPEVQTEAQAQPEAQTEAQAQQEVQTEAQTEAQAEAFVPGEVVMAPDSMNSTDNRSGAAFVDVYVANDNVSLRSGTVTITDSQGQEVKTVDIDTASIRAAMPMTDAEKAERGWSEGTVIVIGVGDALTQPDSYTLSADLQVAQYADGDDLETLPTTEITATSLVNVTEDGVVLDATEFIQFMTGNQVSGTILHGETATSAQIADYDSAKVTPDTTEFDLVNGANTFNLTLNETGRSELTFDYYDADGNYIDSCVLEVVAF